MSSLPVTTLPAMTCSSGYCDLMCLIILIWKVLLPCELSSTTASTPASFSSRKRSRSFSRVPMAAPTACSHPSHVSTAASHPSAVPRSCPRSSLDASGNSRDFLRSKPSQASHAVLHCAPPGRRTSAGNERNQLQLIVDNGQLACTHTLCERPPWSAILLSLPLRASCMTRLASSKLMSVLPTIKRSAGVITWIHIQGGVGEGTCYQPPRVSVPRRLACPSCPPPSSQYRVRSPCPGACPRPCPCLPRIGCMKHVPACSPESKLAHQ